MLARTPEQHSFVWDEGKKWETMEQWAQQVMADDDLSPRDLKVAWVLMFGFNSRNARCWLKKATIAERGGVSVSSVKQALSLLERRGHITRTTEGDSGSELRIIYPVIDPWRPTPEPRRRRGGVAKGVDPRALAAEKRRTDLQSPGGTDLQSPRGTDLQPPWIQDSSLKNPGSGEASGTTCPPPPPDDEWLDD